MAAPLEDGPNTPEETNAILSGLGAKPKASGTSNPRGFRRQNVRKATVAKAKKGLSTGVVKVGGDQELVKPGTVYGTLSFDENNIAEAQRTNPVAKINSTLKKQGVGIKMPQVSAKGEKAKKASANLGDEYTDEVGPKGQADTFQSMTNLANHLQRQINAHRQAAGGGQPNDFRNAESILRAVHGHIMSAQGAHNEGSRVSAREGSDGYKENYPYKSAHPDDKSVLEDTYAEGEEIPGEHLTPAQASGRVTDTAHDHLDMAAKMLGHAGSFLHDLTHHIASLPGYEDTPTYDNNYQGTGQSVGSVANNIVKEYARSGGKSGEAEATPTAKLDTGRVAREDAHTAVYEAPEGRSITDRLFPGVNNRGRDTVMQFALEQAKKHEAAIGWAAKGPGRVRTGTPMGPNKPAPTGSVFAESDGKAIITRSEAGEEPRVKAGVDITPVAPTRRGPEPEKTEGTMVPYGTNTPKPSNPPKLKTNKAKAAAARAIIDTPTPTSTVGTQNRFPTQSPERTARYNAAWNARVNSASAVAADIPDDKEVNPGSGVTNSERPRFSSLEIAQTNARKAPTRGKPAVTEDDMNYVNQALQQGDVGRAAALHWRAANTLPADNPVASSRRYGQSGVAENPKAYLKEAGIKVPKTSGRSKGAFDQARGQ